MPEKEYYDDAADIDFKFNLGNCKRCIHKSSCGNKSKKEADWCEKYRPEIKRKRSRKR